MGCPVPGESPRGTAIVNVLALNCGSSSVKFQLVEVDEAGTRAEWYARGRVERIGGAASVDLERKEARATQRTMPIADHEGAVRAVLAWLPEGASGLDAVGHRVVHGGERFVRPSRIDGPAAAAIEALEELAPLHNGPSLAAIRACRLVLAARIPQVAVFDTPCIPTAWTRRRSSVCSPGGRTWCSPSTATSGRSTS